MAKEDDVYKWVAADVADCRVDPDLGMVFIVVGIPLPHIRERCEWAINLFTSSILALDIKTENSAGITRPYITIFGM